MRDQTRRYVENAYSLTAAEFKEWFSFSEKFRLSPITVSTRRGGWTYLKQTICLNCDGERLNCRVHSVREGCESDTSFSIGIERKACNYGGERFYFLCPRCGRRCTKLYLCGGYFVCRSCGGLHYVVESEGTVDKARRRADKIRKRLGWKRMGFPERGDILGKPKWMHYTTFKSLLDKHDEAVEIMFQAMYASLACLEAHMTKKQRCL